MQSTAKSQDIVSSLSTGSKGKPFASFGLLRETGQVCEVPTPGNEAHVPGPEGHVARAEGVAYLVILAPRVDASFNVVLLDYITLPKLWFTLGSTVRTEEEHVAPTDRRTAERGTHDLQSEIARYRNPAVPKGTVKEYFRYIVLYSSLHTDEIGRAVDKFSLWQRDTET